MQNPWQFACSACLSVALGVGCSSSPISASSSGGSHAGGSPDAGIAASGGGTGGRETCVAPGYQTTPTSEEIDEVDATLHDPSGAPVPNLLVQVCGLDVCVNGTTNGSGKTTVTPRMALEQPAFKYGDGFLFAKLAAALGPDPKQDLGQVVALPLPAYADGAPFLEPGDVTNGDVTLVLVDNALVHDTLTYTDDSELVFRSVQIPLSTSTLAADPSLGFELAYALAPVSTTLCPPAPLRVKNSLRWASGVAVDVFVQGLEVNEDWAPYGGWVKVADAIVTPDGSSILTTSGGIPILSSVALRRK